VSIRLQTARCAFLPTQADNPDFEANYTIDLRGFQATTPIVNALSQALANIPGTPLRVGTEDQVVYFIEVCVLV
jgi:hypothetical protein